MQSSDPFVRICLKYAVRLQKGCILVGIALFVVIAAFTYQEFRAAPLSYAPFGLLSFLTIAYGFYLKHKALKNTRAALAQAASSSERLFADYQSGYRIQGKHNELVITARDLLLITPDGLVYLPLSAIVDVSLLTFRADAQYQGAVQAITKIPTNIQRQMIGHLESAYGKKADLSRHIFD